MEFTVTTRLERWKGQPGICLQTTRSQRFRFALVFLLALLHFADACPMPAQNTVSNEYAVKAAFLFHFAQFVEWPEEAFSKADSPLIYCTVGEDPFQGALDASLKGKTVGARALQVRHMGENEELKSCHVVFIGKTAKRRVQDELASLKDNPVLTVGETEEFVKDNGMIGFCMEENKIRFEINLEAAQRANLKISARLLALARTVVGKPRRDGNASLH